MVYHQQHSDRHEHERWIVHSNGNEPGISEKEIEEKDIANKEQQRMFDEMSQRFQSILQRTTNKLQERVNMGN